MGSSRQWLRGDSGDCTFGSVVYPLGHGYLQREGLLVVDTGSRTSH